VSDIYVPQLRGASGMSGFGDMLDERLLRERIIWLEGPVMDENSNRIAKQLQVLAAEDPEKDITLYINSPGGSISAGMVVYDTMQLIPNEVATVAMGLAASMGQFLLVAGAPGKRFATPNTRIMMHQPSGGLGGTASDIKIQAEQMLFIKKRMALLIAEHSGQTIEQIEKDIEDHSTRPLRIIKEHDENALLLMGIDPSAPEQQEQIERDKRHKAKNEHINQAKV
jgi:ATP-dependent Clp protease protease subunit